MSTLRFEKDKEGENGTPDGARSLTSNIDIFTHFICHRIPERTFKIGNRYFPVCSRCTGFYIGAFSYFIWVYFFYIEYNLLLIFMAILIMIPTFLDGFSQLNGSRESNNTLRFITGLIGGIGLAIIVKAFKFFILVFIWH
jgi:uncharacterized membrane protein